ESDQRRHAVLHRRHAADAIPRSVRPGRLRRVHQQPASAGDDLWHHAGRSHLRGLAVIVRAFAPSDLMMIALQPHQRSLTVEVATPTYAEELAKHGESFTVADDGQIVAVIGLITQWDGCAR